MVYIVYYYFSAITIIPDIWYWALSFSQLCLVSLWWRGDSVVLYFFPSADEYCTYVCVCVLLYQLHSALFKHTWMYIFQKIYSFSAWELFDMFLDCVEVRVYCCARACNLLSLYYLCRRVLNLSVGQVSNGSPHSLLCLCVSSRIGP